MAKPIPKPSDIILDLMNHFGLRQYQLASKLGCSTGMVNHLINNRYNITPRLAIELSRVFRGKISAKKLLTYQAHYQVNQELNKRFK